MIQIDLTPDVKQELLKAERVRNQVVSVSILMCLILVGLVAFLAFVAFAAQPIANKIQDDNIAKENKQLHEFQDINKFVTIQNQLKSVDQIHDKKHITSRILTLINAINPVEPNKVSFSNVNVDTDTSIVTIEAQSAGGYRAQEALKKTIEETRYISDAMRTDEDGKPVDAKNIEGNPVGKNITIVESNFGQSSEGQKVLRFTMTFEYDADMLAATTKNVAFKNPTRQDVTDSNQGLPKSLFTEAAKTEKENQ